MSAGHVTLTMGAYTFEFASTSGLRAALLGSFGDAAAAGAPKIIVHRGDEARPAWLWLGELLRARSEWRRPAGVALQHAVADGDAALTLPALCDLLLEDRSSVTVLRWVEPIGKRHPDVLSSDEHWRDSGSARMRLADAVGEAQAVLAVRAAKDYGVIVSDLFDGDPEIRQIPDVTALEAVLAETATTVRWHTSAWGDGPWGWLYEEVIYRPWIADALPSVFARLEEASDAHVWPIMKFIALGWDTWRFEDLLQRWVKARPSWWDAAVTTKPPGWRAAIMPAPPKGIARLSDLVHSLLERAAAQQASAPDEDLKPLW